MKKSSKYFITLMLTIGFIFFGKGIYIQAKAILAQYLIESSWKETLETKQYQKPWSWADTTIVLKMEIPKLQKDLYVLEGDSGSSLAFAPGHSQMSKLPGENGTILISAHRDTHFEPLQYLNLEDKIVLYDKNNTKYFYRIINKKIIDVNHDTIPIKMGKEELILVTCWPFDAIIAGGTKRYLIIGEKIESI